MRTWDAANGYVVVSPTPEIRTYRGTVSENPNALVIAAINGSNVISVYCFDRVYSHNTLWQASANVSSQLITPAVPAPMPAQAVASPRNGSTGNPLIGPKVPTGTAANGVKYGELVEFEMAADLFVGTFNAAGNNIDTALANYELLAMVYEQMMARDLLVRVVLPTVVIRKETHSVQNGLGALRAEWVKAPLYNLRWDNVWGSEGGVAYSSQIGKNESSVALGALYHESAHNWGASHLVYQCDTMGGNKPSIGPITIDKMRAKRVEAINEGKLPQAQPYTDPLAPFTHVDIARINVNTATDIDVLANDMDANGDVLTISDFTTTTVPGGTVTLNPNGTLHYVPAPNFVGKDVIIYTAQDNSTMGLKTREVVHIEVVNNDLTARYTFDQTTGTSAPNSTTGPPAGLNGANFATDSVPAPLGRGIRASGTQTADSSENGNWSGIILGARKVMPTTLYSSAYGRVTPFESEYNEDGGTYDILNGNYTFATWFRADSFSGGGAQGPYLASKWWHSETRVGWDLQVVSNQLQLHWRIFQGSQGTQTLTAPAYAYVPGKWYHVASVFDRATGQIRLYLNGAKVATKTGAFPSNGVIFNGRAPLMLGCATNKKYCFDDTRIYTKALADADVQALVAEPGTAPRFLSPSMAFTTYTNFAIKKTSLWPYIWAGANGAISFSKTSGPAWLNVDSGGNLTGTPGTADVGVNTAVVRITDGLGATADLTVNLTVANPLARARWKFNEGSGTVAVDSSGNGKTATLTGATWGNTPREGAANLNTNGTTGQYAQATSLNTTGGFTISAWIKPATVSGIHSFISQSDSYVLRTNGSGLLLTTPGKTDHYSSDLTLVANMWQHVMVSFKPSTSGGIKFYLNGVLKSSGTASALTQNTNPTTIGKTTRYGGQDFSGGIDDVRVYGVAMGDGEAESIYSEYIGEHAPVFTLDPINGGRVTETLAYGGGILSATDSDPGDVLVFSKASGPDWLTVAADGTYGGTPGIGDAGVNIFTVRVTDDTGRSSTATLNVTVSRYLLSHWKLDEATGTTAADSSGAENDATVVGASWTLPRDGTSSLTTNGTTAQYASAGPLDTSNGFTISAWVRPENLTGTGAILSQQNSYVLRRVGSGLYLTTPGVKDHISSGLTLVANQWQHVAVSFKPGAVGGAKFYLNGVLKNSVDASALSQSAFPTLLGRTNNYSSQDYNGAMDDVRVYGTALDADTIDDIYLAYPDYTPPAFASDSFTGVNGVVGVAYVSTLAGSVVDPDEGEVLAYSKVSGPAWLTVAADGSLSGTPGAGDVGTHAFVIAVTDNTLLTDTAVLNITVLGNALPVFTDDPITGVGATEDLAYSGSIASYGSDADPGDTLTFSKVSGPAWLNVAANGTLSGIPGNADVGANSFIVKVSDTPGVIATATLNIIVSNVNDAPVFSVDPITGGPGVENTAYTGSIASYGSDPDIGDTITFSKVSGPSWLSVAANGALSGTPLTANIGVNTFGVKITDIAGVSVAATLSITIDFPVGNGTWINLAGGSWIIPGNWSGGLIANGVDKTANFSTLNLAANATVSLDGARTIGNLLFSDTTASHNWTLAPGSGGTLKLDVTTGSPAITVTNGTATLSVPLAGSDGLTKSGVGTLLLTGTNAYTGTTAITAGTLSFAPDSLGASGAIIMNGGTLQWNSGNTQDISSRLTLVAGTTATLNTNGNNVTLASAFGGGTTGLLAKTGNGTLTLSGANTYTGLTTLSGGTLALTGGNNRLASTGTLTFGSGATFDVGSTTQSLANLTFPASATDTITGTSGTLNITSATAVTVGNVGLTTTLNLSGGTTTFTPTLHIGRSVVSSGTYVAVGTVTVAAGATLNGSIINLGYSSYSSGNNAPSSTGTLTVNGNVKATTLTLVDLTTSGHSYTVGSATVNLNTGATLTAQTIQPGANEAGTTTRVINFNGGTIGNINTGNLTISAFAADTSGIILGASGTPTFAITSGRTGTVNQLMSGSGSLTKIGTGTLILGAANIYSGLTTVSEGTLTANVANALGTGGVTVNGATAIYSLGAFSDSVGTVTVDDGGQITSSTGVLTSTGTFEMKSGSASAILAGAGIALNKTTAGTVLLTRANTYTGATTVNEGTLRLTGSLAATATTVKTDATLDGTGTTAGSITVKSGGTLAPGINAIGTLTVNNTLKLELDGTVRMEIAKTGSTLTADKLTGITTVTYGGTLEVGSLGPNALALGDSFQLFSATTYAGSFDYLDLPTLPAGLAWNTGSLAVNGTISVEAAPPSISYASWADGFTFAPEADKTPTGDADHDGILNSVEMVLGGNPTTGMDAALLPTLERVTNPEGMPAGNYFLFTFRRTDLSVAADMTADCQVTENLSGPWSSAIEAPGVVIQTDDNYSSFVPSASNTDRVRVYIPTGAETRRFARLKVSVGP